MIPLVVGTILSIGALAYVLYPLFADIEARPFVRTPKLLVATVEQEAVSALREIEFDRATGKLSDFDYAQLRERYTQTALAAMRHATAGPGDDPVEAALLEYRSRLRACAGCGPRPEPDAVYCSGCGSYLPGTCEGCGAAVSESGAAFCSGCGRQLAA